jgi:predicted AAA+ superfamily ATPase
MLNWAMRRKISSFLHSWLQDKNHKPIVISGARQVGKTWLVRDLATKANKKLIEINFEQNPNFISLFHSNDPQKILFAIKTTLNITIDIADSILFLDEIQAAPEILAKLRWFAEDLPELPVITAGSLLEFVLEDHEFSMPVGRISYFFLEPMSFQEFLLAIGRDNLCDFLETYVLDDPIPQPIHELLWELLREYFIVGGMPAAVDSWVNKHDPSKVNEIHRDLLATYRNDFAKYKGRIDSARLEETLAAIPKLLGQKFKYSAVNSDVAATSIKQALNLLCKAQLCCKVNSSAGNGIPLGAEVKDKTYKVVFLDVGLVSVLLDLELQNMSKVQGVHFINQGKLTEQLVGQLLQTIRPHYYEPKLYYWMREKSGAEAEIDYLIQDNMRIIPIEVKSGSTGTLRSLHNFMKLRNLKTAVRINADYPSITTVNIKDHTGALINYQLLSIPLYLTEQIHRLLRL